MNLVLDFGNTKVKVGLFKNDGLEKIVTDLSPSELEGIVKDYEVKRAIYSSVRQDLEPFIAKVDKIDLLKLSHKLELPITLDYNTPETLGHDRIAAVCGAISKFPGQNCLVIDCGTCITYNLVTKDNVYLGGAISPGLHMRLKSLNTFTSELPLVKVKTKADLIGKCTESSIQSGVVNGIIGEMENYIDQFSSTFQDLKVVMCGGDTYFFENKVKARIFAAPELVLSGLNRILQHYAQ